MSQFIGSDVSSLRHINRAGALQRLRREPEVFHTAADLAAPLGLSRPTVARLLTELVESGWAELRLAHTGAAGRPTRTFRLHRDHARVAAVDAGANNVLVAIADLGGSIVDRSYAPHGHPASAATMAALIRRQLLELLRAAAGPQTLASIVISVPAPVDRDGALRPHPDAPAWATPELPELVRGALREWPEATLRFESAPLAALRAEAEDGALDGDEDALFILAGEITGVAAQVNGAPYRGAAGEAGAIAGLPGVDWRGSTTELLEHTGAASLDELVRWALAGRSDAREALPGYARELCAGLEILVRAFDPAVVVLGGCLAPAGDLVLNPLGRALGEALGREAPRLVCARTDHVDAPVLGGLAAALAAVGWGH